jgi:uncharacterized protein YfiM (DUF2279 family)
MRALPHDVLKKPLAGRVLRVDVKAAKPLARHDVKQSTELWLELHGCAADNKGWLFQGEADVVAVELCTEHAGVESGTEQGLAPPARSTFALLDRKALGAFARLKAARAPQSLNAHDALYKTYARRPGRTLLMRVHLQDAYAAAGCGCAA